jgi:hypothetical protein
MKVTKVTKETEETKGTTENITPKHHTCPRHKLLRAPRLGGQRAHVTNSDDRPLRIDWHTAGFSLLRHPPRTTVAPTASPQLRLACHLWERSPFIGKCNESGRLERADWARSTAPRQKRFRTTRKSSFLQSLTLPIIQKKKNICRSPVTNGKCNEPGRVGNCKNTAGRGEDCTIPLDPLPFCVPKRPTNWGGLTGLTPRQRRFRTTRKSSYLQ